MSGAAATLPFFGGEFLPELHEGHYIVHMALAPGTSLAETIRLGKLVTAQLLRNPHVKSVSQEAGRAENGEDVDGPQSSEFHVELKADGADEDTVQSQIRATVAQIPGADFSIESPLGERMEETLSGATAQFVVDLFGNDLSALDEKAAEVRRVLEKVPGVGGCESYHAAWPAGTGRAPPAGKIIAIRISPDGSA